MKRPIYKPLKELFTRELHHPDLEGFLYTYKAKSSHTPKEILHYLQNYPTHDYAYIPNITIVSYYQEGDLKTYYKAELYEYLRTLIDSNSFDQRLSQYFWNYFLTHGKRFQ